MVFLFIALVISNCIHDYNTSISMFFVFLFFFLKKTLLLFVNNYIVFVLPVTDMAFKGLHDANPSYTSVLVL